MVIPYNTRDGKGNDIIKNVVVKEFESEKIMFECPVCGKECNEGIKLKKIVSSNFTDYAFLGKYVCSKCSRLFSLYFYSYIVEGAAQEIKLYNLRELKDNLLREHETPFKFIITTSQKKHLFYRALTNYDDTAFWVQLETEAIYTTKSRLKLLFDFVECLLGLGAAKSGLQYGHLPFDFFKTALGRKSYDVLNRELDKSREIQIPIYCGQKPSTNEEDIKCYLDLILRKLTEQEPLC